MANTSENATANRAGTNRPVPVLPDLMVMEMYTLGIVDREMHDQYPHIPDTALVVLIRGVGLRRVDDDYDT